MHNRIAVGVAAVSLCIGLLGTCLANDEQIGAAASDPRQVSELVAGMAAQDVPAFAGEVMKAIANMPVSPAVRLRQMREVATAFLAAVPKGQESALLAQLIMHVPLQMLPGWVAAFKPAVGEKTAALDDAVLHTLAADVLKAIDAGEGLSDEDKTIFTTFAIVLLARAPTPEENKAFLDRLLPVLPESYREQVAAAAPAALEGDYTLLLGPSAFRLVEADGKLAARTILTTTASGQMAEQLIRDVNRPAPLPGPAEEAPPPVPSPVIPPPYAGQF
ncbi:MAG: hypothetical protein GX590_06220 [Lentisphaerae bacterium]|nr:hypothetical protein [Lentisphaerota bacterium]